MENVLKILDKAINKKVTPLGWKNFISSFLSQLDPFYGECVPIHGLFKKFVYLLRDWFR